MWLPMHVVPMIFPIAKKRRKYTAFLGVMKTSMHERMMSQNIIARGNGKREDERIAVRLRRRRHYESTSLVNVYPHLPL